MTSATPDRSATGRRLAHLDGLRALAALFVLLHHTLAMAYPLSEGVFPQGRLTFLTGVFLYGHFGVTVFIVLAGYSLTLALARRSGELRGGTAGFLRRRARRIVPPYWAALALAVLVAAVLVPGRTGTHWDLSVPTDPRGWVADLLLLQDVLPGRDAAYPFWSIAVEWHIYLLLPIMLLVRRRTGSWGIAVAFGATGSLAVLALSRVVPKLGNLHPHYYLLFALAVGGCVAVHLRPELVRKLPLLWISGLGTAVVVAVCATHSFRWNSENFWWIDVVLGIAALCLVMSTAVHEGRWRSALGWRPLARVGLFSYSLYLVHAPLLAVTWRFVVQPLDLSRPAQLAIGWLVVAPVLVACAYLFHIAFERPFIGRPSDARRPIVERTLLGRGRVSRPATEPDPVERA
jgi:peptidoglycan/LPS O-acetylase OafA/YrhL